MAQEVSSSGTRDKADQREQTARSFVELLQKAEFTKATASFDETMHKVMPPDELRKSWEKVLAQAGVFQKQLGSRLETSGKYEIVFVTCAFARATWDVRVVFDRQGQITGLFYGPTRKPTPKGSEEIYEGTLKAGPLDLHLVFHLFGQKDGSYAGTMDSPDQGATGLVLDDVTIKEDQVRLELKSAGMVVEGKRDPKRQEIAAEFKQHGQTFPLTLKKVTKVTEPRRPQLPQKPYPYDEEQVTYSNAKAGIKLAGTLTLPRSPGPFPAVLLITGSGPQDRDETLFGHKPFLVLADYLTRRGIAVLRVDDRGVGSSTGSLRDATSADLADDVQAGVAWLRTRKEINPAQIGLIGHSEGGIIAPLVASRSPHIAFIVLLAGTGLPGDEVLYAQGAALLKAAGVDAKGLAQERALQERIFRVLRQEKDDAVAQTKIRAAIDDLVAKLDADEKKQFLEAMPTLEGQIQMVVTPWFRHFLDYDPRPALRKVRCPVLALNGAKDLQVDAKTNLAAIAAALREGGNRDVTVEELPHLNHLFQTCRTGAVSEYSSLEETFAPAALETIALWILKHVGRR